MSASNANRSLAHIQRTLAWYQVLTGVMGLVLLFATLPLWLAQRQFPQVPLVANIPLFGAVEAWPPFVDFIALALMSAGFLAMTLAATKVLPDALVRYGTTLFAIGFPLSVVIDQHRLQPWAIQFFALSVLFAGQKRMPHFGPSSPASANFRLQLARTLVIGIYVWSAIGKVDVQFVYTVGSEMLSVPAGWLGIKLRNVSADLIAGFALSLPLFECLAAAALCFNRTRKFGVLLAVAMHVSLLLILGPLGLDHQAGVLVWNIFSIFQVCLVFGASAFSDVAALGHLSTTDGNALGENSESQQNCRYPVYTASMIALMLILPIGERWGFYDHWPSWGLYAPHSSRVKLLIPSESIDALPSSLRQLMAKPQEDDLYVNVPMDRWSLEVLRAPIYPQSRFQLGVAIAIAESLPLDGKVRLMLQGPSGRLSGRRQTEEMYSLYEIKKAGRRYWFNAEPAMRRWLRNDR